MTTSRRVAALAIALHFFFVLLVVTHGRDRLEGVPALRPVAAASDLYATLTLANRNFGFFAPDVSPDLVVSCVLVDAEGRRRAWTFAPQNREMQIRIYSMTGHFAQLPDTMDLFARSWAVRAMNENPDVVRVEIAVSVHDIPTMAGYRQGRRMVERPLYATSFDLD